MVSALRLFSWDHCNIIVKWQNAKKVIVLFSFSSSKRDKGFFSMRRHRYIIVITNSLVFNWKRSVRTDPRIQLVNRSHSRDCTWNFTDGLRQKATGEEKKLDYVYQTKNSFAWHRWTDMAFGTSFENTIMTLEPMSKIGRASCRERV